MVIRMFNYFSVTAVIVFVLLTILSQHSCCIADEDDNVIEVPSSDNTTSSEVNTGNPEEVDVPTSFSFTNCGEDAKSLPIEIKKFKFSPDPLLIPGIIKFKLSFKVKEKVEGPIKAKLTMERHSTDGWFSLPCNKEGFGSCEYPDICLSLKKLGPICPKEIKDKGLKCSCPLLPGKYSLKTMKVPIATGSFDGVVHFVARFLSADGRTLACLDTNVVIAMGLMGEHVDVEEFQKEFAQP